MWIDSFIYTSFKNASFIDRDGELVEKNVGLNI